MKAEGRDAAATQEVRGTIDMTQIDQSLIGDDQRARKGQLTRQFAKAFERSLTEDDMASQLQIERFHAERHSVGHSAC